MEISIFSNGGHLGYREKKKIGTTISSRIFFSCLMKSTREHHAYCKYCKQDLSIQHGGQLDAKLMSNKKK
jgi:hypothetical protein